MPSPASNAFKRLPIRGWRHGLPATRLAQDSGKITITSFGEAPMLAAMVAEGSLPPVEERLPDNPQVMEPWEEVGTYGGTLRTTSLDPTWDPIIRHVADADLVEMLASPTAHHANLKQFHRDYTDMDKILPVMKEKGFGDDEWPRFMLETGAGLMSWDGTYMMGVMEPLEFPVVNPWQVQEVVGPGEYLFVRNPYYFKIDTAGNQLPYIDYIRKSTAEDPEVLSLKILTGELDVEGVTSSS